jgi:hypothetical protein
MNILLAIPIILIMLVLSCGQSVDYSKAKFEDVFRPYDIKSGYIKYKVSGDEEGTEELWWDGYGLYTHKHRSVVNVKYGKVPIEGWDIGTPEYIYSYGRRYQKNFIREKLTYEYIPDSIVGSMRPNNLILLLKSKWERMTPEQKKKLGPSIRKFARDLQLGIVYKGRISKPNELFTKQIAGRKADVYKVEGQDIRLFMWKGIPLGWEVITGRGSFILTQAEEVKENISVPADKFAPLQGEKVLTKVYTQDSVAVQQERILINELLKTYLPELFEE